MQDATTRIELHPPHSGGNLPTITREPTGHDEPTWDAQRRTPGGRKPTSVPTQMAHVRSLARSFLKGGCTMQRLPGSLQGWSLPC